MIMITFRTSHLGVSHTMNASHVFIRPWIATHFPRMRAANPYSATSREVASFFANIAFSEARAASWNPLSVGPGQSAVTMTQRDFHSSAIPSENART